MAETRQAEQADIVVVGSGVAGALVAYELARAGKSVLMLEAGPRLPRWEIVERFRNQADKMDFMAPYPSTPWAPHPEYGPDNNYLILKGEHKFDSQYIRAVGGTTWHWAASTWRFLPNDFKLRSVYGIARDWPIQYDDLERYYGRAEAALGVWGPNDEELGSPRSQPYPMAPLPLSFNERTVKDALNAHDPALRVVTEPVARNSRPYDGRPTCCGNNNCMPICPIGAMYNGIVHVEKAEQAGARLIENAVVYKLEVGAGKRIVAAHYKDPKGIDHRVEGKWFVLAANGIETPKLMLMSTGADFPKGVGNRSDMVGRNLMDHPGTGVSFYADRKLWPGRGPQEMTSLIGFRDGPFRATQAGKKLHLSNISRIEQETTRIFKAGKLLKPAELDARIRDQAARYVQFDSFHEILPLPENRIVPSATGTDALGIPRPEITYRIDDYVKRSAVHTREVYATAARVLGGTDVQFHDDFAPNNHITGATIMGSDPKDSVVDKDCRTFDHPNLFISSSATMPTVGTVNVTLTIAALALRIADQLKKEA
ncbi:GMC family oxidoreductase [Ralstonia pseudosolanacearum]|uniref:GMC family oxidoreductase n=1 Tax=Ralstonia pseudosolanacearum TaxID=1310165 RepID=UPI0014039407|nr:GMC family oxidoreductase [Ralstonia pseudosolanacearum]KAF3460192.1 GMC family oxidoreductase [Ralstonia solanacearum]NKA79554.1 GMC family oxidoreductase [Ralstonia solanacearum]NKG00647.1 GMC family oxidoreductase [Ralstonia solanacearum]NKG05662.1 GMC family oxidoreductase [Ralstonia solanacearum]QKL93120.1 GMC family oxidoreductase [Ralstonia solanacearum]